MKFKVGDKVRITDKVPSEWWFKPGMVATVTSIDPCFGYPYALAFDNDRVGFVKDDHIELVTAPSLAGELSLTPQAKTVLRHLKRRTISPMEAERVYGIARLASCIHEIRRKAGYVVNTLMKRDDVGHRYARYSLVMH